MPSGNLLLVDDEPALLKLMETYLRRLGYVVAGCTRTDDAWAEFERQPDAFAAVLLDMTMPGLSAQELGARILQASGRTRVILASGYPPALGSLQQIGGDRVAGLQKPFTPEMLAECIAKMLAE